jgi:hypothetical protein
MVSEAAGACPRCAHPMNQSGVRVGRLNPVHTGRIVAIEKTGKWLKFQRLVSTLGTIAGIVVAIVGANKQNYMMLGFGMAGAVVCCAWWIMVRILTWWRHG